MLHKRPGRYDENGKYVRKNSSLIQSATAEQIAEEEQRRNALLSARKLTRKPRVSQDDLDSFKTYMAAFPLLTIAGDGDFDSEDDLDYSDTKAGKNPTLSRQGFKKSNTSFDLTKMENEAEEEETKRLLAIVSKDCSISEFASTTAMTESGGNIGNANISVPDSATKGITVAKGIETTNLAV